jgi:hypothetical protein
VLVEDDVKNVKAIQAESRKQKTENRKPREEKVPEVETVFVGPRVEEGTFQTFHSIPFLPFFSPRRPDKHPSQQIPVQCSPFSHLLVRLSRAETSSPHPGPALFSSILLQQHKVTKLLPEQKQPSSFPGFSGFFLPSTFPLFLTGDGKGEGGGKGKRDTRNKTTTSNILSTVCVRVRSSSIASILHRSRLHRIRRGSRASSATHVQPRLHMHFSR